MNPVGRLLGRILNLVGISTPGDTAVSKKGAVPSWKSTTPTGKAGENGPGEKS